MSYSQSLEQAITVFHFTDIRCCLGKDFEQLLQQPSAADFKTYSITEKKNHKKPQTPVGNIQETVMRKKGRTGDGTLSFWKSSLDVHTLNL